jgi:hypothetical protein
MKTATAAPAADRLRELAAHLNSHSGFSDFVASVEHGAALAEKSFEEFIAHDAKMGRHVAQR